MNDCTDCAVTCDRYCQYHEGRLLTRHYVAAFAVAVFLLVCTALIIP